MALPALLGAGMRAAGGAMVKSGGKAMAKGMFGRKNKGAQQGQPEVQTVNVKVVNDRPQTGNQVSGMSSFLSLPTAKMIAGGKGSGTKGVEERLKSIRDLFAERFAYAKNRSRQQNLEKDRQRKQKREKDLEKQEKEEKSKLKSKNALPKIGLFDGIRNFLLYTLLAFLENKFNFTSQLIKLLPTINKVMDFVVDWGGKILDGLATLIEFGYKVVDSTRGFIKTIGGEGALKVFDNVLGAVNTVLNLLFVYAMAQSAFGFGGGDSPKKPKPRTKPRPGTGGRPKVTGTGGGPAGRPDIRNPLRTRPKVTETGGGPAGKPDIRNPLRTKPKITGDAPRPGVLKGVRDAIGSFGSGLFRGVTSPGKSIVEGVTAVGKTAYNIGKGAIDATIAFGKGASNLYKSTVTKLKDSVGGLVNKGKEALLEWMSKQDGLLGKIGKAAPDFFKKVGKYVPFVGDVVGFVFDVVGGIDWRRALIRAVTGATIDAGFTALMGALGVATPFTGGASGLLATAIYTAYMAADIAAGGFGTILGDKIADFFKLPMRAGEKGGDAPAPKSPGSEADVKKVQEELAKKAASDAEFAKKIGGTQNTKPQIQQPAPPSPSTNTEAKSFGGFVSAYEDGGEVSDQQVEKKLLKKDKVHVLRPSSSEGQEGKSSPSDGLGGFFAGIFGKKKDESTGDKTNLGVDYLVETGKQFSTVPVIGPILALAVNKLLGNDVKSNDFMAAANSIVNFALLNASGKIESAGDFEKYVRVFNVGGLVDASADLGDTMETSRSLSRFLETKFDALSLPKAPDAPARGGPGGGDGTTGPQGVGGYDSATGEYMDYTGGGGLGGGGVYKPILDLIAKYESGPGGYESMYPSTKLPGATKMTIAEVARKATGAVGMYQNMPEFLVGRAKAVGLDPNKDLYNEENQRKIAVYLIEKGQAGVTPQMLKDNPDEAMIRLARVWAAIPVPKDMQGHAGPIKKGQSYYSGVGSNKAHITPEMMYKAMGASVQIQADIASGKLTPGVPGGPGGDPAKGKDGKPIAVSGGSVVAIGKDLVSKGFAVAEHPDFTKKTPAGSYTPGSGHVSNVHKGRGHYEGRAIDVTDWRGSLADSQARYRKVLDSLSGNPSINMLIHDTWGFQDTTGKSGPGGHGHPTHMHIETKKEGGGLIGKSTKEYGNLSQKASYEKGGGTAVVIKPIIIEKQSQNNFMMNPMDKLTFSASERLNNTNAVTSRG